MSTKGKLAELRTELLAVESDLADLDSRIGAAGDPEQRRSLNEAMRRVEHSKAVLRLLDKACGEGR